MSNLDWDDDDFQVPTAGPAPSADLDDLFDFTQSLSLAPDDTASSDSKKPLPPLAPGERDLTSDRGVILKLHTDSSDKEKPSKETPFVELHYEGKLKSTGEVFDSSRDQNYAMIVQLDIPPSGKSTVILGLEIALRELSSADRATVSIASRYAYAADGAPGIPPHADLEFELEVLDVRATHKRVVVVDTSKNDLSRLEDIRRERETAQLRREEESAARDAERKRKADRAAALREKLANKNKGKKGGGKKKK